MEPIIKRQKTPQGEEEFVFGEDEYNGYMEEEEDEDTTPNVVFCLNICPEEIAGELTGPKLHEQLQNELKSLARFAMFIHLLNEGYRDAPPIKAEYDFYHGEGDLLVRIEIPITHPAIEQHAAK